MVGGYNHKYKFKCTLCTRQFTGQHGLDYHMLVHKDLRPAVCPICPNKAYRAFGDLNKHLRNHHPDVVMDKQTLSPNLRYTQENKQEESPQDRSKRPELASPKLPKVQRDRKKTKPKTTKNTGKISPKCPWCPRKFASVMGARIHITMMHRNKRDEFDKLYPPSERTVQTRKEQQNNSSSETTPEKRKIPIHTNNGFVNKKYSSSLESSPRENEISSISKSFSQNSKPVKLKSWTKFFTYNSAISTTPSSSSPPPPPQINLNNNLKNNHAAHSLDNYMDLEESNNNSEISCNYCEDIFYGQKYLDLHVKHWHKNKYVPNNNKSSTPEKSQSRRGHEKKKIQPDNKKPKDRPKVENSVSQTAFKKEKIIIKNEKPNLIESLDYSCPSCGRLFSSLGKLEIHAAVHLRTKVFDCSMCQSSFQNRKELILHRLSIHQL